MQAIAIPAIRTGRRVVALVVAAVVLAVLVTVTSVGLASSSGASGPSMLGRAVHAAGVEFCQHGRPC